MTLIFETKNHEIVNDSLDTSNVPVPQVGSMVQLDANYRVEDLLYQYPHAVRILVEKVGEGK